MKRKVLQFFADLIIKSLEHEKNERAFESLMRIGIYLSEEGLAPLGLSPYELTLEQFAPRIADQGYSHSTRRGT